MRGGCPASRSLFLEKEICFSPPCCSPKPALGLQGAARRPSRQGNVFILGASCAGARSVRDSPWREAGTQEYCTRRSLCTHTRWTMLTMCSVRSPLSAEPRLGQAGTEDGERVVGWMRAEGLVPSDTEYQVLLKIMTADARWGEHASQARSITSAGTRVWNPTTHACWGPPWGEVGPCRSLQWRRILSLMAADGGTLPSVRVLPSMPAIVSLGICFAHLC
jgi:hypothetical protein